MFSWFSFVWQEGTSASFAWLWPAWCVLGQLAENLEVLLVPTPLFVQLCLMYQEAAHSAIVLHTILFTVFLQSMTLSCPAITSSLNSTEFNYNQFPCLCKTVFEDWSIKGIVIPPLLSSDSSLSTFWNAIYEFSCRPTWLLQFPGFHLILEQSTTILLSKTAVVFWGLWIGNCT